ncbi:hypothetical protein K1T71_007819 [Dendrolimus kikuchii]|uniref:Uncharacterized protein n=1 Tax=Dendrolimus kikuchii TaxID=765133 RepID=A0ACC1CYD6_9NEOP|nr:hypothetical protein K1T71_007819 [Dendrolimus kikuchii]
MVSLLAQCSGQYLGVLQKDKKGNKELVRSACSAPASSATPADPGDRAERTTVKIPVPSAPVCFNQPTTQLTGAPIAYERTVSAIDHCMHALDITLRV